MLSFLLRDSKARRAELATENGASSSDAFGLLVATALPEIFRRPCCAERRKREAMSSVSAATGAAVDAINGGAATVWHNQQQLEAEARLLHQQTQRLAKQSSQWVATYQGFHQALKDLGDVENWAKAIESDMAFIHSALDGVTASREQQD